MVNQSTSLNLLERLRTFLELGRISNLPTVFTNLILGVALAKGTLSYYEYVLLFIYGCSFYVAGMYLNDLFDYKWDLEHNVKRPLVQKRVSFHNVKIITSLLFLTGFLTFSWLNYQLGKNILGYISPVLLLIFIIWYNYDHKDNKWAPLLMGACRFFLIFSAYGLLSNQVSNELIAIFIIYIIYVSALTYAAKFEHTNNRNIKLLPKALLVFSFILLSGIVEFNFFTSILFLFGVTWTIFNLGVLNRGQVGKFVTNIIAAMIILDGILITSNSSNQFFSFTAILMLFLVTLKFQKIISGT